MEHVKKPFKIMFFFIIFIDKLYYYEKFSTLFIYF